MTTPIREIAFIDTAITDWETLLAGLNDDIEVVILDSSTDGVLQIAERLRNANGLSAIHIFSHGSSGELMLGAAVVNAGNLGEYNAALATIGSALTETGDILLYGCNVAQGRAGEDFIARLAALTGADVAASTDATGNAVLGGDWVLEVATGTVESELPLELEKQSAYSGVLAVITGTTSSEVLFGTNGNDTIDGKGGNDLIDGGAGTDTAVFSKNASLFTVMDLSGVTRVYSNNGGAGDYYAKEVFLTNVEYVQFADQTVALGTTGNTLRIGNVASEILNGTSGNDTLDGRGGNDVIDGGAGTDTAIFFRNASLFTVMDLSGVTRVYSNNGGAGDYYAKEVFLTNVEYVQFADQTVALGTTGNTLRIGNVASEILNGTSGNDTLDGRGGNDVIDGGAGTDTAIFFRNASLFTVTDLGGGVTRVYSNNGGAGDYYAKEVFLTNVEYLQFADQTVHITTTGPVGDQQITGTSASERLNGGSGSDVIDGKGGDDLIDGGAGMDTAIFFRNASGFTVMSLSGVTRVWGDNVSSMGDYAAKEVFLTNVESLQFADQTVALGTTGNTLRIGSSNAELLNGTGGNDTLDGRGGNDLIDGGAGTDTAIFFRNASGFTVMSLSGVTRVWGDNVSSMGDYAAKEVFLTNVESLQFADQTVALGTTGNTLRIGSSNAELLNGTGGNDTLDGRGGNDLIDGGAGTDTAIFFRNASGFTVSYLAGGVTQVYGNNVSSMGGYAAKTVSLTNVEYLQFVDQTLWIGAGSPPTVDTVREGTDTTTVLAVGATVDGMIDPEPISGDGVLSDGAGGYVDKDWYQVTLSAGHSYHFSATAGVSASDTLDAVAIRLYDATGAVVSDLADGASPGVDYTPGSGGTYYLAISAGGTGDWQTKTGDYQVSLAENGIPPADDYAGSTATTGTVPVGGSSTGSIETTGDTDWFKVTLTAGHTYRFDLLGAESGNGTLADPFMRLRDSAGTSLVADDNSGLGFDAQITYQPTVDGTYFVSVGSSTASGTGSYKVSVADNGIPSHLPNFDTIVGGKLWSTLADFAQAAYPGKDGYREQILGKSQDSENWKALAIEPSSGSYVNGLYQNGYLVGGDFAAAFVARCGDAAVISFGGTDEIIDGVLDLVTMTPYTVALQPLVSAFNAYVADPSNEISKVYVTGHSLGGALASWYMMSYEANHSSSIDYEAVTFAAPGFNEALLTTLITTGVEAALFHDPRVHHIEISGDVVPDFLGKIGDTIHIDAQGMGVVHIPFTTLHTMYLYEAAVDLLDSQIKESDISFAGTRYVDVLMPISKTASGYDLATGNDALKDRDLINNFEYMVGGDGNDVFNGRGANHMYGGAGNDTYTVDQSGDVVSEETRDGGDAGGWDTVIAHCDYALSDYVEVLRLEEDLGPDKPFAGTGNNQNNRIEGNGADNLLKGLGGNDTLIGGDGLDALIGGDGNDTYVVDRESELATIIENVDEGNDTLSIAYANTSTTVAKVISLSGPLGAIENITIADSAVVSTWFPPFTKTVGTGLFNFTGNSVDNVLTGNGSTNILNGEAGNDDLYGAGGVDTLIGGDGNDLLVGGSGGDFLTGGIGNDRFVFSSRAASDADRITDFTEGDLLVLQNSVFKELLGMGPLNPAAFGVGNAAMTHDQHLLYDGAQGYLYYDADGSGVGAKVLIAALTNHPVLDAGDFWVV